MSLTIALIPLAIAVSAGTLIAQVEHIEEDEVDSKTTQILEETLVNLGLGEEPLLYKTIMRNATILQEAVLNLGYQPEILNQHQMVIKVTQGTVIFEKSGEDVFQAAIFRADISKAQSESYISEIQEEYTKLVQERTYQKLLEKIKKRNLNLESEEVTEDNSIVLTLVVQE